MKTTTKKIKGNSAVNQKIKEKFVEREVKACFSYEMEAILKVSFESKTDLPSWEDVENLYEYNCPNCGQGYQTIGDFGQNTENRCEFHCPSCQADFDTEPENEPQEIFEWWIVTGYLYHKLKKKGEPVLEWGNNWYWGRTTTGQAILLDGVITSICRDMEILDGQANSWAD